MPRAIDGSRRKNRRRQILKQARGYWGRRSNVHRTAKDAVSKSLVYAYRDRKNKKRDFRALWIARISAAARNEGINYSRLMNGLKRANVQINRKALSNMAIQDPEAFREVTNKAKSALGE